MTLLWIVLAFLGGWLIGEIHAAAIQLAMLDRFRLQRSNLTLKHLRKEVRNLTHLVTCQKALDTAIPVLEACVYSRAVPAFKAHAALQCIKEFKASIAESGDEN